MLAGSNVLYITGCFGIFSIIGFHVQDHFALEPAGAARWMGLGLMAAAGTNVVAQALIIRRFKLSPRVLLAIAVPLTVIAFTMLSQTDDLLAFVAYMSLNGLGQGLAGPAFATALSLSVGAGEQGRIAGVSASIQAMAFLVGPVSAAALYQAHSTSVFAIGCVLAGASLIPFLLATRGPSPER